MKRKRRCIHCMYLEYQKSPHLIGFCRLHSVSVPDALCWCERLPDDKFLLHNFPQIPSEED